MGKAEIFHLREDDEEHVTCDQSKAPMTEEDNASKEQDQRDCRSVGLLENIEEVGMNRALH